MRAVLIWLGIMPIFEYECLECGDPFEFFQRTVETRAACPACGTARVERTMSLCAVSSDGSRAANLSAAHQRAAGRRQEKQRSEHASHHGHFEDVARGKG
jgi:putative FmdB family regulatory protein